MKHPYQVKSHANYAIDTYGSELAGDILNCALPGCNKPYSDLIHQVDVLAFPCFSCGRNPVQLEGEECSECSNKTFEG